MSSSLLSVELKWGKAVVTTQCPNCWGVGKVRVNPDDYRAWRSGQALLQEAFPYLSAPVREQIKSGIHPMCWIDMFGTPPWFGVRQRFAYRVKRFFRVKS